MPGDEDVQPGESMDTGEGSSATDRANLKRTKTLLDPDTETVIVDAKKPKIDLNEKLKVAVLKFIMSSAFLIVYECVGKTGSIFTNLNMSMQVMNVFFTAHNVLRQKHNGGRECSMSRKIEDKNFTLNYLGKTFSIPAVRVLEILVAKANEYGLVYKSFKRDDSSDWYGVAGPYICFFTGFGLRYNELRLGHGTFPKERQGDEVKEYPVYKYGLGGVHHPLLEGITFPPEKRSSMAQSVGPMTAFLCYIRAPSRFADKWKRACKRALSHIPHVDDILEAVVGKDISRIAPLISHLGDILLISTSRQAQRAFFPVLLMRDACLMENVKKDKKTLVWNNDALKNFTVSGRSAFIMYNRIAEMKVTLTGTWTGEQVGEIMYHCIFGTFKEDFGVLREITDRGTWSSRENLGNCFQRAGTSGSAVDIIPVKQVYYSKLASANQTGLLSSNYSQVSSVPVFSGHREVTFSNDFFSSLRRQTHEESSGKSLEQLTAALSKSKSRLLNHLERNNRKIDMGTTTWYEMKDATWTDYEN